MLLFYITGMIAWILIWLSILIKEIFNGGGYPVIASTCFLLLSPVWPTVVIWYVVAGP